MSRPRSCLLLGLVALGAGACTQDQYGGLTATLDWSTAERALGGNHRGLRAAIVPPDVGRLQIQALDVVGSTLAETNLYRLPANGQLELMESGDWELIGVRSGADRQLAATAYLDTLAGGRFAGMPILAGLKTGLVVRAGEITDAGAIELGPIPGVRFPPLDGDPPDPPNPLRVSSLPEGEGFTVEYARPLADDVAGYVIAVGSSVSADLPELMRSEPLFEGGSINGVLTVERIVRSPVPEVVTVTGLNDLQLYRVVVYAFDDDFEGEALNYSRPAFQFGTPRDTLAPGPVSNLSVVPAGTATVSISFGAPGEDGATGRPARYELKIAPLEALLSDPLSFPSTRTAATVAPLAPPATVNVQVSLRELGVRPGEGFFIGVRAVDAADNLGPIAVAPFTQNPNMPPQITALVPEIAVSPGELRLLGTDFGASTGTALLFAGTASTTTVALSVLSWSDTEVRLSLPAGLRSGTLRLERPDRMPGTSYVPIVVRMNGVVPPFEYPFELVSTASSAGNISALYREADIGADYEGAVERLYDLLLAAPAAVGTSAARSTQLAGTYSADHDLYYFLANNAPGQVEAALVSSAVADNGQRLPSVLSLGASSPDRMSVVIFPGGVTPAGMVAFSLAGTVRTATAADLRTQGFSLFTAYTSTVSGYDAVQLAQRGPLDLLLGYRSTTGTISVLALATNITGLPGDFVEAPAAVAPRLGERFQILVVPDVVGDEYVVVYESLEPSGRVDVRALRFADFGLGEGYAPFEADALRDFRLEDAGVILRQGQAYVSIAASRLSAGQAELRYLEVPIARLTPGGRRGAPGTAGVILDTADDTSRARIGCKLAPLAECPLVWLGQGPQALFIRR